MKQKYSELPNGYLESIDRGIRAVRQNDGMQPKSLQEYHSK